MCDVRSLRLRSAMLSALLALHLTPARAQAPVQARTYFERGVAAMRAGRPADAVAAFTASLRLRASPVALFNLGLAHRAAGNRREAWIAFGRFVNTASNADPTRLAAVRAEIESLRSQMGLLRFENVPPNTELSVDGQAVSLGTSELMVDPGSHVIRATIGSGDRTIHALVQRGGTSLVRIDAQDEGGLPPASSSRAAARVAPPPTIDQGSAVRACQRDEECAGEHRCERGACVLALEAIARPTREQSEQYQRFTLDVGGGLGLAFLPQGRPPYAEYRRWQFVSSDGTRTTQESCGPYLCPLTQGGIALTEFLSASIRYNFSRRVGIGLGFRFQFESAGWEIQPPAPTATAPNPPTTSVSNPFADVLFNLRVYIALTSSGFARSGFTLSMFAGGGVGQISPRPLTTAITGRQTAHIQSGYGNFAFGVRLEYGLRAGFHFGAEIATQFMMPTFLFNIDITPFIGFHL